MLRHMKPGMLLFSIVYILLGLALLILPDATSMVLCFALGALVLLSGLEDLTRYFKKDVTGPRAVLCLLLGLPTVAVGVLALVRAAEATASIEWILPLLFGLMLLLDGLVRLQSAWELCRRKGQKWWVVLLLGLVSLVFGALLAASQLVNFRSVDLMLLSGIFVLAEGILNLCCTIYIAMEFHALDRLDEVRATMTAGAESPVTAGETCAQADDPSVQDGTPSDAPADTETGTAPEPESQPSGEQDAPELTL